MANTDIDTDKLYRTSFFSYTKDERVGLYSHSFMHAGVIINILSDQQFSTDDVVKVTNISLDTNLCSLTINFEVQDKNKIEDWENLEILFVLGFKHPVNISRNFEFDSIRDGNEIHFIRLDKFNVNGCGAFTFMLSVTAETSSKFTIQLTDKESPQYPVRWRIFKSDNNDQENIKYKTYWYLALGQYKGLSKPLCAKAYSLWIILMGVLYRQLRRNESFAGMSDLVKTINYHDDLFKEFFPEIVELNNKEIYQYVKPCKDSLEICTNDHKAFILHMSGTRGINFLKMPPKMIEAFEEKNNDNGASPNKPIEAEVGNNETESNKPIETKEEKPSETSKPNEETTTT